MNVQICRNDSPAGKAMAVCAALLCGLLFSVPAASAEEGDGGDAAKNPEIKPCPTPDETGSCDSCPDNDNNSSGEDNECVMVRIGLGDPFPASSGIATHLRLFSQHPSPELYSPSGLRLVTGFSVMYTTGGRTADGAPRSVVVLRPSGLAVTFTFADGESVAAAPDGTGKAFPYRLVMVDAQGWTTLSEPAFYDLYPGDGSSYRFVAAKAAPDYLQFVRHVSPYGQVSGLRELGVEAVRDAGGGLLQVRTAARLADIRILGETSYAVRLYPNTPAAVSALPGADGRYAVLDEGALIEELVFSDPGGEMKAFNVARTAGGATTVSAFTYTGETRDWTLVKPGGRVKEKRTVQTAEGGSSYRITSIRADADGTGCYNSAHDFAKYPWGAAVTTNWSGGFGSDDWKAYEYYKDAPLAGFLKRVTASDGSYKAYAFDAQRRKTSESGGGPGLPEREALYAYVPVDPAEAGLPAFSDSRPRTVTEKIGGVEVSRVWHAYPTNALGGWMEIEERASFQGASYGHPSNPRTVKTWHAPDAEPRLAGRLASVAYPGGKTETHDYAWGLFNETDGTFTENPDGDAWRETVTTVYPTNLLPVTSYLLPVTRSLRVWDSRAREVLNASYIADGDAFALLASSRKFYDDAGHLVRTEHSDGRVESATWGANCCGKESATAADGTVTVYGYNELKQKVSETRKGLAPDGSGDITTLYTYDFDDRVLSVAVTNAASGLGYVLSRRAYDLGGRVTNAIDRLGNATRTSYAPLSTTVIRPNGVTAVTERYPGGKTRSVLENGTVKHSYAYGVNPDGTQWTLSAQGPLPAIPSLTDVADLRPLISDLDYPWQLQITDPLGRLVASHTPGINRTVLVTSNTYDTAGNLLRSESSSTGGVYAATLYSYAADGALHLTALDLNTNGVIDLSGPDRVTGTSSAYEKDASNFWWRVSRQWVYPESGSASAVTTSVQRTLLTNLGVPASTFPSVLCVPWLNGSHLVTSLSESIDIRGNSAFSAVFTDRAAKTVISAALSPASIQPAVQMRVNGLLSSAVSSTAVTNTYAYDGLAQQVAVTDGRGNTTVTAYTPLGLVAYTENAATNRTTYDYDSLGRRISVTDALGNNTHTAYDEDNRVIAQWGATYPVSYEYDTQGRMVQMGTYRGAAEITDYANFQSLVSSFDKTVWLYDQPTGLLTNKLYADGLGTAYTYTPDGKLATRLWARGITTTYAYTPISGELASIDYSDDTSDIAYTFNRLGQMLAANNTVSTNTFTYSPDTLELVSETQNGSVLARPTDAQGRPAGLALGEDYGVTYGYDDLGHFSSVSSSVLSVSSVDNYFRLPGTDIISGYTAGPLTVTKSFEPNRDLITSVSNHVNQVNPVLISAFDYANDAISRRVFRHDSGLAFEQSQTNAFGYNPRSEVTGAVMHTNAYGYVYDPIGNRLFSSHNAETNSYAANALNQYSQISAPPAPLRYPLYDADGNMTFDGKEWFYVWNGENRLVLAFNAQHVVTYAYDCRGRMVWKTVSQANASSDKQIKYVWDDYNIIAEHVITNGFENITYNVWGLDLSGTLQGAGGVGGLLSVHKDNDVYFPAYDANGNITEYISSSGTIAVHREYSAFGETTVLTGALPDLFTHWWSTKPWCIVTELSEYIYRKYKTDYGRWLSPDPLSEIFPREKYIFLGNSAIIHYDLFGLMSDEKCKQNADRFMSDAGKYSKTLKDVLDEINAISGCSPLSPECECCKEEKANWLGYTGEGNRVVLCSNNLDSGEGNITQNILETLVHEHIHVLQRCRNQDNQTCDGAVCTEIQAYLHDGTCHRKAPGNVKQCVIDGAAASAANRCENGQNEAKQRAEALYEKCNLPIKN